jgi:anaerobic magnesium-protoporphyrin IX monomethyl ester cyclase
MSKKVVFVFPSFASSDASAPLGRLAVATPLLRAGYSIRLIESTITPNHKNRVLEEAKDAWCLGISLLQSPMIRETVEIARAVKAWDPFPVRLKCRSAEAKPAVDAKRLEPATSGATC